MTKFLNWEQLQKYAPVQNGVWNKQYLYEYLVKSCHCCFQKQISQFFNNYKCDEVLLLQAQKNDVFWKRPFSKNDNLKWLNDDIAK